MKKTKYIKLKKKILQWLTGLDDIDHHDFKVEVSIKSTPSGTTTIQVNPESLIGAFPELKMNNTKEDFNE